MNEMSPSLLLVICARRGYVCVKSGGHVWMMLTWLLAEALGGDWELQRRCLDLGSGHSWNWGGAESLVYGGYIHQC
jgi:hypothetical protein